MGVPCMNTGISNRKKKLKCVNNDIQYQIKENISYNIESMIIDNSNLVHL